MVTSFEYRLHPVGPKVMFCFVSFPGERAKEVLRSVEEYTAQAFSARSGSDALACP